jgi:hypothetical protein
MAYRAEQDAVALPGLFEGVRGQRIPRRFYRCMAHQGFGEAELMASFFGNAFQRPPAPAGDFGAYAVARDYQDPFLHVVFLIKN